MLMATASKSKIEGYRLVLASSSPRRQEILKNAGYEFEIMDPGEAEDAIAAAPTPEALAIARARAKAMHVAASVRPPFPVLIAGADTLVALGDDVLGKPLDRFDAAAILTRLSGSRHRVISGLCLWPLSSAAAPGTIPQGDAPVLASASTWVQMRKMSAEEIETYVATGQSDGKAGAYAIQENGDRFVKNLEGSFLNVVGFPLELFQQLLRSHIDVDDSKI